MIIKLAINIPASHLKGDGRELASMKKKAKGILHTISEMQAEDKEAMQKKAGLPPGVDPSQFVKAFKDIGAWAKMNSGINLKKGFIPKVQNNIAKAVDGGLTQAHKLTSPLLKRVPNKVKSWATPALDIASSF